MLTAIIVAAGSSRRAGFDKLTVPLNGKPVLEYSLAAFQASKVVSDIILVVREDRLTETERSVRELGIRKLRAMIAGGEHRQDSVAAGLRALDPDVDYVAVHDAARPLVTSQLIDHVFAKAREHGAASAAEPVNDTLKRADADLAVTQSVEREQVFAMQTPQIFERKLLEQAYRGVADRKQHITDEVTAVQQLGRKVILVPSGDPNFKITRASDLKLAEMVLRSRG